MGEFRMPALGADMEEGTVLEWLVAPGDTVRRGDVIAVVDTDKAVIDVECFESGVVDRLLVEPGTRVPVGAALAVIGRRAGSGVSGGPSPDDLVTGTPRATTAPEPPPGPVPRPPTPRGTPPPVRSPIVRHRAAELGVDLTTVPGTGPEGMITRTDLDRTVLHAPETRRPRLADRARVSPYARKLAALRGVDPSTLTGSGPGGLVRARDVLDSAAPRAPQEPRRSADPRAVTAALMARSNREIPHYYLSTQIELGPAADWLRAHNREVPVAERVLPAALLLRAVVLALGKVPELNGHWLDGGFRPAEAVHLGVAVSLRGGGLAAPVVRDAGTLGLDALMARLWDLTARARGGHLRSSEMSGATVTVTNLGDLGVDVVTGVIHPPQIALVGFGTTRPRPWAIEGQVTVRPVVDASLAADHRASDGTTGARLLRELDHLLHKPEELR
ncbi:dihydrolipoamide acetyltransferase family protein [Pseudonocardia sp. T1-2H]|uniref:dihydrolipoamide acetyltransferase family protein n=1 Tax=Pseudonocardia sp. T1-2H TaxID=3128899 RepID=UPI0031016E79